MKRLTNSEKEIPTLIDNAEYWRKSYFKLKEYEDLEEQGKLIKLPCRIGAKVYKIMLWGNVREEITVEGKVYSRRVDKLKVTKSTFKYSDIEKFGKEVFLTSEEAEAKLKELRGAE